MDWKTQNLLELKNVRNKPIEIYVFIDPFCEECWLLNPIIKKLQLQYGDYFTLKQVLCGNLTVLNNGSKSKRERTIGNQNMMEQGTVVPHLAAISIKAAELQGKRAGFRFLRRLQELIFAEQANITDINTLEKCAQSVGLDCKEFIRDIYSSSAARAFQCDIRISSEMNVAEMPAMVFFNEHIEDEGLKITGLYSYSIYVQILKEMLGGYVQPENIPPLEKYLSSQSIITTHDLSVIYDMPYQQMERKMKKLQLQQKVEKINSTNGSYWKCLKLS
ncbi:MAG TPA: DsbA family protein [Bacillus bacterium]|nr:ClpXP adapter SpxH family protein [Siminovitchia fordii]HBZ10176.1 DsbA family protein [Bacillus sp. (in: firmicutes)]